MTLSRSRPRAETTITGSVDHLRSPARISMPSISGRLRSSSTRSGQCELMSVTASRPRLARMVSKPLASSTAMRNAAMVSSSSTIRILSFVSMAVSFAGFSVRMIFLYSAAVSLSGGTGSEKLTAVPPSVLRALMLPPCAFTMDMHTERPMPSGCGRRRRFSPAESRSRRRDAAAFRARCRCRYPAR